MPRNVYNLPAAAQGASANFVGGHDHFQYEGWNKFEPYFEEEAVYSPINNTTVVTGGTASFDLERRHPFLRGDTEFTFTASAIAGNAGARFNDWTGFDLIDRIEFVYNNKRFWQETGERMRWKTATRFNAESRTAIALAVGGNLTDVERTALALAPQTFTVPIWVPWRKLKKQLPMIGIPNKIRVNVFMKAANLACFAPIAPFNQTWTYSNVTLRVEGNDIDETKKAKYWNASKQGITIKTVEFESHVRELVPAGTTTFRLKIRNIKNDAYLMYFTLRQRVALDDAQQRDPWDFFLCQDYRLEDSNQPMFDTVNTARFFKTQWHQLFPDAENNTGYHVIWFCPKALVRASEDDCYGSRAMVHYNNPELVITFAAPTASDLYLDLVGEVHNSIISKAGDVRQYLL